MSMSQIVINKSRLSEEQYKELMNVCKQYNINYEEKDSSKKMGPKYKVSEKKFKLVYSQWIADNLSMDEALKELSIEKPTFFKTMKRFGLSNKSDIKAEEKAKAMLLGIDGNKLLVSHEMEIKDILEVVKKAVYIATFTPRCSEVGIEYLDELVCCFVLDKMKYEGSKQLIADEMRISKTTYLKYIQLLEDSPELYNFASRIYKKVVVLPK